MTATHHQLQKGPLWWPQRLVDGRECGSNLAHLSRMALGDKGPCQTTPPCSSSLSPVGLWCSTEPAAAPTSASRGCPLSTIRHPHSPLAPGAQPDPCFLHTTHSALELPVPKNSKVPLATTPRVLQKMGVKEDRSVLPRDRPLGVFLSGVLSKGSLFVPPHPSTSLCCTSISLGPTLSA